MNCEFEKLQDERDVLFVVSLDLTRSRGRAEDDRTIVIWIGGRQSVAQWNPHSIV